MGRDSLGEFEQLVLLGCLRLGEGAYTVAIIDELEARTGRKVSHASVYVALKRLEDKGLVVSELGGATAQRGGRSKRYFRTMPAALPRLRESRDALIRMWEGVEPIG